MIILANTLNPRLRYIGDFTGSILLGKPFELTTDREAFMQYPGPKINYSRVDIGEGTFRIEPHPLLFEKEIQRQTIDIFTNQGYPAFFRTGGDLSFDIFAASFYLLSRYEEYLPHRKDIYGRFAHEESLAYKEKFLHLPLVNIWLMQFREVLGLKFPGAALPAPSFSFLPTYDIDEAYSYKYKSGWRNMGGAVKELLRGRFDRLALRRHVLANKIPDPFESYDWMDAQHARFKLSPRYFFLVAATTGRLDRNILPGQHALESLIRRHSQKYTVGLHPSWQSGEDPGLLRLEKSWLEKESGSTVISSRQHFIRFNLPATFRQLLDAGIQEDFSMGYGSINGFRASVTSPFYWYDLEKEAVTGLRLFPFCYMEANSYYEQKNNPAQALDEMREYYEVIKTTGGMMISIWHNTFLGTEPAFAGWRETYLKFLEEIH